MVDFPAFWNPEVLCEGSAYSMLPEDVVHRNADDARKLIHDLKELLDEAEPAEANSAGFSFQQCFSALAL